MTTRTKILYVITKSNWGGAQRYVYDLATSLPHDKFEVSVAVGGDGMLAERLREACVRVIHINNLQRDISLWKEVKALYELYRLFKKEHPHVIHLNSSKAGILGGIAARAAHVPRIIFTAHGWAFNEKRPAWQRILLYIASMPAVLFSDKTICVSNSVFNDICGVPGVTRKLKVIYLGVTSTKYKTRKDARNILARSAMGRIWIGMVSELHPTKRVEDAITAIKKLKENHPNILLLVAGEGEHRAFLEKEIKRQCVDEHVKLLGFVPDIATYMKAFEIFLFPSHTEALGYALLEAGHSGLPVVATRAGGIPEVITDEASGILVPPERPEQLARTISQFLNDPSLRTRTGETLSRHIQQNFNFERMYSDTIELYQN